jgi:hypothetical protein
MDLPVTTRMLTLEDDAMFFEFELRYIQGLSWPIISSSKSDTIVTNESVIDDHTKQINITLQVTKNTVQLLNTNKTENETIVENNTIVRDQHVLIEKIRVDNILLDLNLIQDCITFTPQYHAGYNDYCKQHGIIVENKLYPYDLYFNGTWEFNFEIPFWPWYACLKKQQAEKFMTADQSDLFLGIVNETHTASLCRLKTLLKNV